MAPCLVVDLHSRHSWPVADHTDPGHIAAAAAAAVGHSPVDHSPVDLGAELVRIVQALRLAVHTAADLGARPALQDMLDTAAGRATIKLEAC